MAIAQIFLSDNSNVVGYIQFIEKDDITQIVGVLSGLSEGEHGLHIHEKGDPTKCCNNLGGHYNPTNKQHGDRLSEERHVGDLGNITFDSQLNCTFAFTDKLIKVPDIVGRSIIIHKDRDDLGLGSNDTSKVNGNSGERIAYGIIGRM